VALLGTVALWGPTWFQVSEVSLLEHDVFAVSMSLIAPDLS
jgi:hypothetical protein